MITGKMRINCCSLNTSESVKCQTKSLLSLNKAECVLSCEVEAATQSQCGVELYRAVNSASGSVELSRSSPSLLKKLALKAELGLEPVINNESCIHNRYFSLLQFFPKLDMGWFINYSFC